MNNKVTNLEKDLEREKSKFNFSNPLFNDSVRKLGYEMTGATRLSSIVTENDLKDYNLLSKPKKE